VAHFRGLRFAKNSADRMKSSKFLILMPTAKFNGHNFSSSFIIRLRLKKGYSLQMSNS
jgi:hypothetical protein